VRIGIIVDGKGEYQSFPKFYPKLRLNPKAKVVKTLYADL